MFILDSTALFMVLFAIIVFFASTLLYKKAAGTLSISYPNIISIVFYLQILFQLIAALLIGTGAVKTWWVLQSQYYEINIIKAFFATYISFLLLPLFIIFFERLLIINAEEECFRLYKANWETVTKKNDDKNLLILIFISLVFLLLSMVVLFKMTGDIPLFGLIKGVGSEKLAIMRGAASDVGAGIYIKNIMGRWVSPFITLVIYGYLLTTKRKLYLGLFVVSFMVTFLYLFYTLEKAPIMWFIIMLIVFYSIFKGKLSLGRMFKWSIVFVIIIVIMYLTIMGNSSFQNAFSSMANRIFFSQYAGTVLSFDYFPEFQNYLLGKSFIPFAGMLGIEGATSYSLLIMRYYNPKGWAAGSAGYASTLYIAEGYANFGYLGILLSIIIVAFWITLIYFVSMRARYHPVSVAFIVLLMVNLSKGVNGGLSLFIYSPELIAILLAIIFSIYLSRGKPIIKFKK